MVHKVLCFTLLASCVLASNSHAQDSDTTPPALAAFNFEPKNVNVTTSSQNVVVTLQLSDDLSGAQGAFITFVSPTGGQSRLIFAFNRIAGNSLNGTYQGIGTFQPFIESGMWTVGDVHVVDVVGNRLTIDTATLAAAGFPTQLFVVSNPDVVGPTLVGITVTPEAVDVSGGERTVTVELQIEDNLSGVSFDPSVGGFFGVEFFSPAARQVEFISNVEFSLATGTITNGAWSATARFPQYSEAGTWRISSVFLEDAAGNESF